MQKLDELIRKKESIDYTLYYLREFNIHLKYINTNKLSQLLEESLDSFDNLLFGLI